MGKKKKVKKSKEELEAERIQLEEDERARAEEEAKVRAQLEAQAAQRAEEDRLERKRQRGQELARLAEEAENARALAERRAKYIANFEASRSKAQEWENYTTCSTLPAGDSQGDINTYIKMLESDHAKDASLDKVLAECAELEAVMDNFSAQRVIAVSQGESARATVWQKRIGQLFAAQISRLDAHSASVLANAEQFVSPKMEVLIGQHSQQVRFGLWINLASKGFRMKTIEFPGVDIVTEIPKTLALQSIAIRVLHAKRCTFLPAQGQVDTALGGVLFVETLKQPPMKKIVKGWNMVPVNPAVHNRVERLDFNADAEDLSAAITVSVKVKLGNDIIVRGVNGEHLKLVVQENERADQLPADGEETPEGSSVVVGEAVPTAASAVAGIDGEPAVLETRPVRVGVWNPATQRWSEEGVSDASFEPVSRLLSFTTSRHTALGLLVSSTADIPYRFWSLTPILLPGASADDEEDRLVCGALLTLRTDLWLFKIEIRSGGNAKLIEPQLPELKAIVDVLMPFQKLLSHLSACGINLIASETLVGDSRVFPRLEEMEVFVYEKLSRAVCSMFSCASSKWNSRLADSKCCVSLWESGIQQNGGVDMEALMQLHMPTPTKSIEPVDSDPTAETSEATYDAPREESETGPAANGEGKQGEDAEISPRSSGSKKKKSKKAKKSTEEEQAEKVEIPSEEAEIEQTERVEEDPIPGAPRTILFESDREVFGGIKCAFIRAKDTDDKVDTSICKDQTTHVFLDNALLASGIYTPSRVHLMQDNPVQTPLCQAIQSFLRTLRVLSLTTPKPNLK